MENIIEVIKKYAKSMQYEMLDKDLGALLESKDKFIEELQAKLKEYKDTIIELEDKYEHKKKECIHHGEYIDDLLTSKNQDVQRGWHEVWWALNKGYKAKLPEWQGYWYIQDGKVIMHCKDDRNIPLLETKDEFFTLSNMARKDWIIFK